MSPNCRQCGAPLPAAEARGACATCGTLFGGIAEVEEYARAVVAGRTDLPRPAALPGRRMKVSFESAVGSAYREGQTPGRLRVRISTAHGFNLVMWPFSAATLACVIYVWQLRGVEGFHFGLAIASLLIGLYALKRTLTLFDRFELEVADGVVRSTSSRFWPRAVRTVRIEDIAQLYAAQVGRLYALLALKRDGKKQFVAAGIGSAELALYLERQVEAAAGLADAPVPEELARNAPLPAPPNRLRFALIEMALIGGIVTAGMLTLRGCGTPLATLDLTDEAQEAAFSLDKPARIFFSAELELRRADYRYRDGIPRALRYELGVLRGDQTVTTLTCDPVEMFVWVSGSHNDYIQSLEGSIDDCSVELPAGSYRLRARRVWNGGVDRPDYEETRVVLRTK